MGKLITSGVRSFRSLKGAWFSGMVPKNRDAVSNPTAYPNLQWPNCNYVKTRISLLGRGGEYANSIMDQPLSLLLVSPFVSLTVVPYITP